MTKINVKIQKITWTPSASQTCLCYGIEQYFSYSTVLKMSFTAQMNPEHCLQQYAQIRLEENI